MSLQVPARRSKASALCAFALLWPALLWLAPPSGARAPLFHWEKIHVDHALPSQVFRKLGLTHITKAGHTRGSSKADPDPTFPAGLTDVVPYDTDHLILARGTEAGLQSFRKRVAAADIAAQTWKLHLELWRGGLAGTILATQDAEAFPSDAPTTLTVGTASYQVSVHPNPNGTLAISLQRGLPLRAAPSVPPADKGVFVPAFIWTPAATETAAAGSTASFEDRAADRRTAREKLGDRAADDGPDDYAVRVTATAAPPPSGPAEK